MSIRATARVGEKLWPVGEGVIAYTESVGFNNQLKVKMTA
jgi:hypothetical protein